MSNVAGEKYRIWCGARRDSALWATRPHDARGRRSPSVSQNETMPLDRLRGGGVRSPEPLPSQAPARPPQPELGAHTERAAPTSRRIPLWVLWAGGGAILLAVMVFIQFFFMLTDAGFLLIVRGAPSGSEVYIDNVPRGITHADGTIRVPGLESGKRLVRVSHERYADFNTAVTGKDGETRSVIAQLTELEGKKFGPSRQPEIDYNGAMMLIPSGEFIMGDDAHLSNERPAHKVTLTAFYIDKFEVTNAQYKRFCDETGRPYPTNPFWDDRYFNDNPNSPVVGVDWHDATVYAKWAGKRLPTEEEWEKASSWEPGASRKRIWPWGDDPDSSRVLLGTNRPPESGRQQGNVSAYGVYDLAGGVAEWVSSFYQPYPGSQTPDSNYGTKNRVVRGGHFRSAIEDVRSSARYYSPPEFTRVEKRERTWLIGFRCAVSADDPGLEEFKAPSVARP